MRMIFKCDKRPATSLLLSTLCLSLCIGQSAFAANFVYQGHLADRGQPANGKYDIKLSPFAAEYSKTKLAEPLTFTNVTVIDGRFELEFELAQTDAENTWLEIAVSDENANSFATIAGRSKAVAAPLIGQCWSSTGDSGSNAAVNFLGTTDDQSLVLRAHNAPSLRIEPSAILFAGLPINSNVIAGSYANFVGTGVRGATISGGGTPVGDSDPFLTNEAPNTIFDAYGSIGGGVGNQAGSNNGNATDATFASIGGGFRNLASAETASIGGGVSNTASGGSSTISGGTSNAATAASSTVAGGAGNAATGGNSFVAGGFSNCAGGLASWAGGNNAKVRPGANSGSPGVACTGVTTSANPLGDQGSFVWADTQSTPFVSTGNNQFMLRANGGVGINAAPISAIVELMVSANDSFGNFWLKNNGANNNGILFSTGDENGNNNSSYYIDHFDGVNQSRRLELNSTGSVVIRSSLTNALSGVIMPANSGAWGSLSDRHVKTAINAIDPVAILNQLLATPISSWSYIAQGEAIRHIGPMAQDFAQFGFGESDTHISTIDADGIALAAIQGLNQKLEQENAALQNRLQRLEQLVAKISSVQEH